MKITPTSSAEGKELTIKIEGRFDFSALQAFRNAYEKVLPVPERFIIDLKDSDYLDSSALGMLLSLRDHAGGDAAKIRVIGANSDIKKILMITKLDELFTIE